ncbi:hypothetical protein [Specibacter cremeus]|uniref:hypothetical protein n=1 Tax=Specibacter cremeus TaxID=1629051 RepID=UPI000F76CD8A|nr:hypothetical protein [Specibacter cremeus]
MPLSAGLLANINAYHEALTAYRAGEPDGVIRLCSEAALRAVHNGTALAEDFRRLRSSWRDKITARADSAVWPAIDLLVKRPVVNRDVLEKTRVRLPARHPSHGRPGRSRHSGRRGEVQTRPLLEGPDVLDLLDAFTPINFAQSTGRRRTA